MEIAVVVLVIALLVIGTLLPPLHDITFPR